MSYISQFDDVSDIHSAYDFQSNKCRRNAEMLRIQEIQLGIQSM